MHGNSELKTLDYIFCNLKITSRRRIAAMAKPPTPSKASFDSLAEKRSINFNTTAEIDSFENVITNPVIFKELIKKSFTYFLWETFSTIFYDDFYEAKLEPFLVCNLFHHWAKVPSQGC